MRHRVQALKQVDDELVRRPDLVRALALREKICHVTYLLCIEENLRVLVCVHIRGYDTVDVDVHLASDGAAFV